LNVNVRRGAMGRVLTPKRGLGADGEKTREEGGVGRSPINRFDQGMPDNKEGKPELSIQDTRRGKETELKDAKITSRRAEARAVGDDKALSANPQPRPQAKVLPLEGGNRRMEVKAVVFPGLQTHKGGVPKSKTRSHREKSDQSRQLTTQP